MLINRKTTWLALLISLLTVACDSGTTAISPDMKTTMQPGEEPAEEPAGETYIASPEGLINPEDWSLQQPVMVRDPDMEQRIIDLMARMTLEEKVGQIMQADIGTVTPEKVRELNLGSVLNGGGSAPGKDLRGTPESWLDLADEFWEASTDTSDGGVGIPVIWGTDAVHGSSNIVGATLFPHNIGLGAANDPDLMYNIGRVSALEILVTGQDWTFAPTIAVARNDRWGRTYESYSEDPKIVAAYAPRIVEGIQGKRGTDTFLDEDHTIATAKHFTGDGGTFDGVDQGDNRSTETEFREIHSVGYPPAIAAGAQTVMASYSSFHGQKMHGLKPMLTDVLVGRMGFDGFVVGDWNGHAQVTGCSKEDCAASFNAGLDMFMVPDDWEALYHNTLKQVKSGEISEQRLDEAVARILRVKFRAGVMDAPKPSARKHAGDWALLSAPEHKAIAREAVRKSLVLLKNDNSILPLSANANVLVTGDGADNIGKQSGGWTLSWQGTGNVNEHFPNGTSIFEGIRATLETAGGSAVLSEDGDWEEKPDVAIVVYGENPYAEGVGDRPNVDYAADDGLELLKKFREAGIPTISIFISGRALWVNPELNLSDAFVAAWLPGSEGAGVADVLIADAEGNTRFDFTGRLSYSWPANAAQAEVNVGDADYNPLFPYGYGLSYGEDGSLPVLSEDSELTGENVEPAVGIIELGKPVDPLLMKLTDAGGETNITDVRGASPAGTLEVRPADYKIQEDTFIASWNGYASLIIEGTPVQQADENLALEIVYQVMDATVENASLAVGQAKLDIAEQLNSQSGTGWQTSRIRLSCLDEPDDRMESANELLAITADGTFKLQITSAKLLADDGEASCD